MAVLSQFTMPLLRPGIDVAVHTELRMLSTAAWLDFKQHVILVQALGGPGRHFSAVAVGWDGAASPPNKRGEWL